MSTQTVHTFNARLADAFDLYSQLTQARQLAAASSSLDEYSVDVVAGLEEAAVVADRLASFGAAIRAEIDADVELGDFQVAPPAA